MRVLSACLLSFLITLLAVPAVFAHTEYNFPEASQEQVNEATQKTIPLRFLPNHPLYFALRIKESISRFFTPSSAKRADFDFTLATKRIKESYLMLVKNDLKKSSRSLKGYSQQLNKTMAQLDKARSQNQDVVPQVARMAEEFRFHEIFLSEMIARFETIEDGYDFDENLNSAIDAFSRSILALNNISPGLKDRFPSVVVEESTIPFETTASALPKTVDTFQSTPGGRPKRIIY